MKLFGHVTLSSGDVDNLPSSLAEVAVSGSASEIRKIAVFFNKMADEMEEQGEDFEHSNLSDYDEGFKDKPQLVVINEYVL